MTDRKNPRRKEARRELGPEKRRRSPGFRTLPQTPPPPEYFFDVAGNSMWFHLREGDRVCFRKEAPERLRVGDVVVLLDSESEGGRKYVVHRLLWKQKRGGGWRFWTRGDWSREWDSPALFPLGRVVGIQRNGMLIPWDGAAARAMGLVFWSYSRLILGAGFAARFFVGRGIRFLAEPLLTWTTGTARPIPLFFRRGAFFAITEAERVRHYYGALVRCVADGFLAVYASLCQKFRPTLPARKDLHDDP